MLFKAIIKIFITYKINNKFDKYFIILFSINLIIDNNVR